MKFQVFVRLKPGVLDVQGKAVEHGLHNIGCGEVSGMRIGKLIEFDLECASESEGREKVRGMCEKLLANTIIEDYEIRRE